MITNYLAVVLLQLCVVVGMSTSSVALREPQPFKVREPNLYAPHLYADHISFTAMLLDLPGAKKKQSYWQLSYQLYFIPEDKYYEALRHAPRGPSNPTPEEFPGRVLLAEGHKRKTGLAALKDRTISLPKVPLKEKVPDSQRTKFAHLMTAYSLKIFDAELNTTVYRSGIFLTEPYEPDPQDGKQAIARKNIYLTFRVNSDGTLNRSQLPPKIADHSSR